MPQVLPGLPVILVQLELPARKGLWELLALPVSPDPLVAPGLSVAWVSRASLAQPAQPGLLA